MKAEKFHLLELERRNFEKPQKTETESEVVRGIGSLRQGQSSPTKGQARESRNLVPDAPMKVLCSLLCLCLSTFTELLL